ncbi:TPA: hypothetical protein DEQ22_01125 [Candidatus Nomurabacteria bacterium]|uniref:VanZ-like domain-containing protein n=2 Tax=Candidatus Nomuraibacteriota TaxID=1752729 RepID=A0A1F6YN91_9BACT|nr:MAG: hypothetical protein UV13_C0007G0043 [Parcubacteria group bacterium GW2011_GWC1_42_21]KKS58765.1 MAG: hypothetical protein UV23_C0001G0032 [Candidatus Nomurabacteria bacterium GW2011_GWF1_42_40]KKT00089.1 MAG: hypothetical protein UV77_C0007G0043 [Candidatus Nomurabacteria bacterium GW2011_GWA1_43_17]KKT08024.1 MAG: hypothetical protein UV85_C0002G0043 [Candidatus Nomurabacteria bacterium GW2011_GWB1_43_19]KKT11574.1 MAG: hypothetical protein UV91_C0004G0043 [Candidatus Nomurabacteria b
MDKKGFLKHLVFLMFFIFIADLLARNFYWYSLIWYFDMIMHFLSGLWVGLFFFYVLSVKSPLAPSFKSFLKIILLVLIIGISYEIFEFIMNVISVTPFDPVDTTSDLFFDMLGAAVSIFYFMKVVRLKK